MNWAELTTAIFNTLAVAAGVLILTVPVAFFLAVLIMRTNALGARFAWLVLCSQLVVPLYAVVGAWSAGFGTQGWWPLSQAFVGRFYWASLAAVTFIHAVAALPSVVLILVLGLGWTRRSQEELAIVEGGFFNLITRVWLPDMRVWIAAASLWAIVPVLTEMVVTNLYQVPTLPEQIYLDISLGSATALTYTVSVVLCTLPLLALAVVVHRHLPGLPTLRTHIAQYAPTRRDLGPWRLPLSTALWTIVLLVALVPLCNLLLKAGWETSIGSDGQMAHRWTLDRFVQTLIETSTLFHVEFKWSATLAVSSSVLALALACWLRWHARASDRLRSMINFLCLILIAMPGPLVAGLMSQLFLGDFVPGLDWFYDHSLLSPILAQQTRLLPLAWLIVGGIVSTVSPQAWEMARVDRLPFWTRLRFVLWRPTWRLWLIGWVLLCAVSAGELSTHLLLLPPGVTTVAQRLFEFLHFGMRYQDSGLCLALVLLGWLVAIGVWNTRTGRA